MPFVLDTFEATRMRSLAIIPAHTIMFQVLTGMRSSRSHRMWSGLYISSNERGRALQDAARHQPRAACAVRGCDSTAGASNAAAFTYSAVLPRCQVLVMAAFERCL